MGGCLQSASRKDNYLQKTQEPDRPEQKIKQLVIMMQLREKQAKTLRQDLANTKTILDSLTNLTSEITIRLKGFNGITQEFNIPKMATVLTLKRHMSEHICSQLTPQLMVLLHRSATLNQNQQLSSLVSSGNTLQITQRIAEIWELRVDLTYDANRVDEILGEKGAIQLRCSHFISREGFRSLLGYQLDVLKSQSLYCPFLKADGNICRQPIDKKYHQLFAGLVLSKWKTFLDKFSQNYVRNNTILCPSCPIAILKDGLDGSRVQCPNCRFNFCKQCNQKWAGDGDFCRSQRCFAMGKLITNAPWTRVFQMNKPDNSKTRVNVPKYRGCPSCFAMVQNEAKCKHTACICGVNFCFVCLSIKGDSWPCGGPYDYCKNGVAAVQDLNARQVNTDQRRNRPN